MAKQIDRSVKKGRAEGTMEEGEKRSIACDGEKERRGEILLVRECQSEYGTRKDEG